ncbi:hypothetical protein [Lysinibacillus capsici]|uniref:hypothetical protein n=1 Tax=Lysinibacillus capsici TaxID=2115968 RepID=UPI000E2032FE|nr:hypothetical protein [Lysinibacillus capsici]RDV28245.1 hypothetical protein C7B89_18480 [Lysinibacillus capsici]
MGRRVVLFNVDNSVVRSFVNMKEAQDYCKENNICNEGWISRSLKSGEKFYDPATRKSRSRNGYEGYGMYVKWEDA